ncbi:response regulator transcription factor [Pseudoneobacillus sp. C159]
MTKTIMFVDDDYNISKVTGIYLKKAGYQVQFAYDGEEALDVFQTRPPDAIILDLMLPKLDGMAVCEKIRRTSQVPIIMLTAKGQTADKIEGLKIGADDYVVKPFDPNELLARLEAVLRRVMPAQHATQATAMSKANTHHQTNQLLTVNEIILGNLAINEDTYTVAINGQPIKFPKKEFELLLFLAKHPNRVFGRDDLIERIWGWDFEGEDRVIDLYIKRIRAKLKDASVVIKTVWGVGYQLLEEHSS